VCRPSDSGPLRATPPAQQTCARRPADRHAPPACTLRLPDFTPYQLSLLLLGLGKVRRSVPNTWASTVLDTFAGRLLPAADPGDVCRLVGALGRVVVKPGGSAAWLAAQPAAQQQLQQCVAWVLPQLAQVEPPWLVLMVKGLVHLQCHLPPQQVRAACGVCGRGGDAAAAMSSCNRCLCSHAPSAAGCPPPP
jgi:hypothetical protein